MTPTNPEIPDSRVTVRDFYTGFALLAQRLDPHNHPVCPEKTAQAVERQVDALMDLRR